MQIRLLKILALLGSGDKKASESMYTVLGDVFRKVESSSNIGNAVLYECICCVSSIYPNQKLIDAAAGVTSRFLKVCSVLLALPLRNYGGLRVYTCITHEFSFHVLVPLLCSLCYLLVV